MEFGTGALKITPAHDINDYEIGDKHNLETIDILNDDGTLSENAILYVGKDRFEVRKIIAQDLKKENYLVKVEEYKNKVGFSERTDAVIEPKLSMQWFLKMEELSKPALKHVMNDDIKFHPPKFKNTYRHWMENIKDWCLSRQLWWGHRIPAWYDTDNQVYVGESEAQIRRAHGLPDTLTLTQDEDVLDTWFSSALWTFSTLGWPQENPDLNSFHPASVLVTGFDIIFFWVARMIMMSLEFMDEVPFHTVYVHGLVRDGEGQKMSKSKGNVLDPIDLIDGIELDALVAKRTANLMQPQLAEKIEKATRKQFPDGIPGYGTDALRYTFYSLASTGRDIKFDIGRMEGYRNFCNKIWNAARYVLSHTEGHDLTAKRGTLSLADRWIRSRLQSTLQAVEGALAAYRFDLAAQALYDFVWNEFCDWYLELSKPVLWDEAGQPLQLLGTRQTLAEVLEQALRMLHPFMPFVTEEIWQSVSPLTDTTGDSIMLAPWPTPEPEHTDLDAEEEIEWMKGIIVAIRTIRSEANIPPATMLNVTVAKTNEQDRERLQRNATFLQRLSKSTRITPIEDHESEAASLMALFGELEVRVPMAGLVDVAAELARLDKEIARVEAERVRLDGKLTNAKFTERAPADIVTAERQKLAQADASLNVLRQQRLQIEELRSG